MSAFDIVFIIICVVASLAAVIGIFNNWPKPQRPITPAHRPAKPSSHPIHPGLLPIPLPTPPGWHTQAKITMDLPNVYRDEVDAKSAIDSAAKMGEDVGMSNEEILKMVDVLTEQLQELPEKPPEENDTCPECGSLFALVDDYLCPKCRAAA